MGLKTVGFFAHFIAFLRFFSLVLVSGTHFRAFFEVPAASFGLPAACFVVESKLGEL